MQVEVTLITGCKVTVKFDACPAEPENGIFNSYVEDWSVVEVNGVPGSVELEDEDTEVIEKAIGKALDNPVKDFYEPDPQY